MKKPIPGAPQGRVGIQGGITPKTASPSQRRVVVQPGMTPAQGKQQGKVPLPGGKGKMRMPVKL